uniref:Uncharacterized protein n=1 Tax=Arundo donax TaxID=35708 RepID=A0A0A9APN8_ARUDO
MYDGFEFEIHVVHRRFKIHCFWIQKVLRLCAKSIISMEIDYFFLPLPVAFTLLCC